jgi:hypothetical protein
MGIVILINIPDFFEKEVIYSIENILYGYALDSRSQIGCN